MEFNNGNLVHQTQYLADPFDAPAWCPMGRAQRTVIPTTYRAVNIGTLQTGPLGSAERTGDQSNDRLTQILQGTSVHKGLVPTLCSQADARGQPPRRVRRLAVVLFIGGRTRLATGGPAQDRED